VTFIFRDADVLVQKAGPVSIQPDLFAEGIAVPGSKSLTNRFLLLAALSGGTCTLKGALDCQDSRVMSDALSLMGCDISWHGQDLVVHAPPNLSFDSDSILYIENAGTAMRFLLALTSLFSHQITLDGNRDMRRRPQSDLVDALQTLGARATYSGLRGCAPITIEGPVHGGKIELKADVSSQFLSALLMVLPLLKEDSDISLNSGLVSRTYVAMTLDCLSRCGIRVESNPDLSHFHIPGRQRVQPFQIQIEPDASTASYWFALPVMLGGRFRVEGLPNHSFQGDFGLLDIMKTMGLYVLRREGRVDIGYSSFSGIDVSMNSMSDVAPTLAVIATRAETPTLIRDVGNMRVKECDRIAVLQQAFDVLGLHMESGVDWMRIVPGQFRRTTGGPVWLNPHEDHRMAMVFTLLGLHYGGIGIRNYACVEKTYPAFFNDFTKIL
jgi:3-phosphoshikimate 1-carboxyvinyltransferase